MFDIAMKRYGAIPMRFRSGFPPLASAASYGDVLTRIKSVLDPNNILSRNFGLFPEVVK